MGRGPIGNDAHLKGERKGFRANWEDLRADWDGLRASYEVLGAS